MSVPAVLVNRVTKKVVKKADYPREDMSPFLEGEIHPDYFWLIQYVPYAEPLYDPSIYIMDESTPEDDDLLTCPEHPNYPGIKAYTYIFTEVRRPDVDIIRTIENAKKEANDLVNNEAVHKDEFAFMMSSIYKDAKGQILSAEEQGKIDKLLLMNVALAKNDDTAANKIAQVVAGQVPNVFEGWEKSL